MRYISLDNITDDMIKEADEEDKKQKEEKEEETEELENAANEVIGNEVSRKNEEEKAAK